MPFSQHLDLRSRTYKEKKTMHAVSFLSKSQSDFLNLYLICLVLFLESSTLDSDLMFNLSYLREMTLIKKQKKILIDAIKPSHFVSANLI